MTETELPTFTDSQGDDLDVTTYSDGDVIVQATRRGDAGSTNTVLLDRTDALRLYHALGDHLMATAPVCGHDHLHSVDCTAGAQRDLPDATEDGYDWPQLERGNTVTAEAEAMVYGDRGDDYGHPRLHWTRAAIIWTGLLQHKLAPGEHITPEDVGRLYIGDKLARDTHQVKRDNRVDIAGYALCLDRLETGK